MTSPFRFDGTGEPETEEERRKRQLREAMRAAQLGLPLASQLPAVTITAPRSSMLDASARRTADLAAAFESALAETERRRQSPMERLAGFEMPEVAPDVTTAPTGRTRRRPATISAQPEEESALAKALNVPAQALVQPMLAGARFREAVESTPLGRLTPGTATGARRTQEVVEERFGPKSGLAQAVAIPAAFAGEVVPYVAAGGGIPGLLRSAAITGLTSQRPGGSTVEALGELSGSETLKRLAESPLRTAADIGLDVGINVLPGAVSGLTKGFREAARATRGGVGTTRALARQAAQNIAEGARQVGPAARAVGQQLAAEPLTTAALAASVAGEAAVPGAGLLAAALPGTLRNADMGIARGVPSIPQEVRSVGRFGFVRLPETYTPNLALETEHVANVIARTEPILSRIGARTQEAANGAGLFGGDVSPNSIMRFAENAPDEELRTAAAVRGLAFGQDQQLWYRKARPEEPNTTAAFVLTGKDFAELPDEAIDAIVTRLRADDALGPYGGATRDGNHLLALNLKRYTGMDDEQFGQAVRRAVDEIGDAYDIDVYPSAYYAEHLDGSADYVRAIGRRPDALRAARDAIVDAEPEYLRYAQATGADVDAARREIADRVESLDRLLQQVEQPPPLGRTQDTVPVAQAARQVYSMFPRLRAERDEVVVPEMVTRLNSMVGDLVNQNVIPREMAQDFYRGATLDQRKIARLALPELREDPKYTLYTVVNSILSSGQQVPVETRQGLNVFDQYLRTGRFSILNPESAQYKQALTGGKKGFTGERGTGVLGEAMAASPRTLNHEQALARLDALVQAFGEEGAVEALVEGVPIMAGRTVKEERPALVYLFGPKIGQYAMDKLGIPGGGKSTIDLWMARLDYALRGDAGAIQGNKLNDTVLPTMRRRMQGVLAEFAAQNNMPESSAQALAWYAIKNAFRNAGGREKRMAYATLGSATTEAMMTPIARELGPEPLAQGLTRPGSYEQAAEGWNDPRLREFARRTGRAGTIAPTTGAFAGKVFDITGAGPEAVARAITSPGLGAAVGAGVGALQEEEDRFGGAMRGALAGAAVGTAGRLTKQQLIKARMSLRAAKMPQELAESYALSKGSIDFSGEAEKAIANRAPGGFRKWAQRRLANYEDGQRELDRLAGRAEAVGMAPEESVATMLDRALGSQATAARALARPEKVPGIETVERGGVLDPNTREIVNEPLEDVFAVLGGSAKRNEQGLTYATAVRRVNRYDTAVAAGDTNPLRVYGGDEALLSADRRVVEEFGKQEDITEFAQRLQNFMDAIGQYAVKSGLWTEEQYAAMRESDALYIPFKRLLENIQGSVGTPMTRGGMPGRVTAGVKEFTGSNLMLANPAEAIGEYVSALIARSDRYRVGSSLIDTVNRLGDTNLLTPIASTDPRARSAAQAIAEEAYRTLGVSEQEAERMADLFVRVDRNNAVIWRNGPQGREYFLVNDPDLWSAIETLNPQNPDAAVQAIVGAIAPLKRMTTAFATGYAPSFWLGVNIPRDIITAVAQNPDMTVADMAYGFREAAKAFFGRSEAVERITREGAGQVTQFGGEPDVAAMMQRIAPTTTGIRPLLREAGRGIATPVRAFERAGRASEMPMRLAAARAARRTAAAQGVSEAGQRALESRAYSKATVDFRRKAGNQVERFFEQTVPFYAAAKKGGVAFARATKDNPKAVGAVATGVVLATVMEHVLGGGTAGVLKGDEAKRQEQTNRLAWERARAIRVGDFKLALPQELAIVAAATRVALASLEQDDPFVYEQLKESILSAIPPVYSDVVGPLVFDRSFALPFPGIRQLQEIAQNRSAFTGRPIVPESMLGTGVGRGVLPAQRRYETTPATFDAMAAAARAMGMEEASPLQMEYLARGLTGRFTSAITAATDPLARMVTGRTAPETIPTPTMQQQLNPLSSFVVAPARRTQAEEQFFKLRNRIENAQETYRQLDKRRVEATERGDEAGVKRVDEEVRIARRDPAFEEVYQERGTRLEKRREKNPNYFTTKQWLDDVQERNTEFRDAQQKIQEDFANNRITGATARKELQKINDKRSKLYRLVYDTLSKRFPE